MGTLPIQDNRISGEWKKVFHGCRPEAQQIMFSHIQLSRTTTEVPMEVVVMLPGKKRLKLHNIMFILRRLKQPTLTIIMRQPAWDTITVKCCLQAVYPGTMKLRMPV